jgi:hypothetical protein
MCVSAEAFHGLISAAGKAGAAVLLYSRLQGFDHERLTRAYGDSVPDVVFAETDDDWVRVSNAMRVEAGSVLGRLLRALYPRIRMFPVGVARQTAQLFAWGPVPATVAAFSRKTGEQTATVRRVFARNGLMPPHIVLVAARLARAWYELPECDGAFALLAERHGFGSLRSLERWCRESLESTPRRVPSSTAETRATNASSTSSNPARCDRMPRTGSSQGGLDSRMGSSSGSRTHRGARSPGARRSRAAGLPFRRESRQSAASRRENDPGRTRNCRIPRELPIAGGGRLANNMRKPPTRDCPSAWRPTSSEGSWLLHSRLGLVPSVGPL